MTFCLTGHLSARTMTHEYFRSMDRIPNEFVKKYHVLTANQSRKTAFHGRYHPPDKRGIYSYRSITRTDTKLGTLFRGRSIDRTYIYQREHFRVLSKCSVRYLTYSTRQKPQDTPPQVERRVLHRLPVDRGHLCWYRSGVLFERRVGQVEFATYVHLFVFSVSSLRDGATGRCAVGTRISCIAPWYGYIQTTEDLREFEKKA